MATKLVEQWLKIVKSESLTEVASSALVSDTTTDLQLAGGDPSTDNKDIEYPLPATSSSYSTTAVHIPSSSPSQSQPHDSSTVFVDSLTSEEVDSTVEETSTIDPLEVSHQESSTNNDSVASSTLSKPKGLVYKITVKDGKQVLAKVDTSTLQKISSPLGQKQVVKRKISEDSSSASDVKIKKHSDDADDSESSSKVSHTDSGVKDQKSIGGEEDLVPSKDSGRSIDKSKLSRDREMEREKDKERSKDHKSSSSRSASSSTSSKPKSSSSSTSKSHSSSSRSSRDEKDRNRSSSSKSSSSSSRDKSREKSASSKSDSTTSQANKDKETLSIIMPQSTLKIGKIPKKVNSDATTKLDTSAGSATISSSPSAKKPSISIEVRKDFENRPKTVKTFNSKFRSHGLAEEAPPPPSRKGLKKPQSLVSAPGTTIPPSNPTALKRLSTSPTPEMEKKPKLDISIVSNHVDKPGSIKLISPKPKRKYSQSWTPLLTYFCPFIRTGFVLLWLATVLCVHLGRLLPYRERSTIFMPSYFSGNSLQHQRRRHQWSVRISVGVFYV